MAIRVTLLAALCGASLILAGCGEPRTGPLSVVAIGDTPQLRNPNLEKIGPGDAFLIEAVAQGLVQFDSSGEIEPALARSWIVSDDGLRYTFRIQRTEWTSGERVTAEQVSQRLRATYSRASRNRLKPVLGAVADVTAMTDEVLEISLVAPRPNFLELLAQPSMAIIRNRAGTGPYAIAEQLPNGGLRLAIPSPEDGEEEESESAWLPPIHLRGDPAAIAVARFAEGEADLVIGGTIGHLPLVRAASPPATALTFDTPSGLFGLKFLRAEGVLADPQLRRALAMAIDRQSMVAALGAPGLEQRASLVPPGLPDLVQPPQPDWATSPLPMRRELAARTIAAIAEDAPLRLRVAMPEGPGYRLVLAHLRRDWRLVGVEIEPVEADDERADLGLVDDVAPARIASWYLRHFTCDASAVCDPEADTLMNAARHTMSGAERRALLGQAAQRLTAATPFIALTAPVRWSLSTPRLTGFRANPFARHTPSELIAQRP